MHKSKKLISAFSRETQQTFNWLEVNSSRPLKPPFSSIVEASRRKVGKKESGQKTKTRKLTKAEKMKR